MTQEILLNITPHEVRAALIEEGILQEIHIERRLKQGLLGNFYKGKVHRVLPGIQAAFIDIGLERAAFLHVSDIQNPAAKGDIRDVLKQGQEILVQVYKDSLGSKGVRVTTQFSLPGRYLVFVPGTQQLVISQKITNEFQRARLMQILMPDAAGGYIFRTAAASAASEDIIMEGKLLPVKWTQIVARSQQAKVGELVYAEIPMELRLLRDTVPDSIARIRVDQLAAVSQLCEFAKQHVPRLVSRIEYHASDQPIFDIYSVETQLQKALHRKVYLKSGGYLIFDQTEAMTTIDVNTGSFLGRSNQEETIFKTNRDAISVIAHQIRLRNLGGIIIIDFIDMSDSEHKAKLLQLLTAALAKDSARIEVSELSSLGLVQMTRKRTRESLERILCVSCPVCQHRGTVKSIDTMSYEILRELQQTAKNFPWPGFFIVVSLAIADYFLGKGEKMLSEIELLLGKPIKVRGDSSYVQEQYDILPMSEKE
ncbi:MAG: ribonuclease [Gammaproteobacteria bacterium]|jgi:ribonuclease G|nr:ribonuclease [Gammaproteobacteria bacterium]